MSVMRCDKHDRHWDSDMVEQCPLCASEPQAEPRPAPDVEQEPECSRERRDAADAIAALRAERYSLALRVELTERERNEAIDAKVRLRGALRQLYDIFEIGPRARAIIQKALPGEKL